MDWNTTYGNQNLISVCFSDELKGVFDLLGNDVTVDREILCGHPRPGFRPTRTAVQKQADSPSPGLDPGAYIRQWQSSPTIPS